jgi:ABC-type sugar transport system permease subunit
VSSSRTDVEGGRDGAAAPVPAGGAVAAGAPGARARRHARRRPSLKARLREVRRHPLVFVFGLVLPLGIYIAFVGYPIVYNVWLSFHEWDGISSVAKYVGLENYRTMFHDSNFWLSFKNTVKWTIGTLLFTNVLALVLAVVLRSKRIYFGTFLRLLFFLPVTMSLIAVGLMFSFILTPGFGAIDQIAQWFGYSSGPDLLGQPNTALYTLIAVFGWAYFGIALILFDAGLTQIPQELYESARLDGANSFEQFRFVTLPMLRPISMVVAVLAVLEALRAFDLPYIMTRGGPANATSTLGYSMWIDAFDEQQFGYGAAIGTVMLILSAFFAIVYVRRAGRDALGEGSA